MRTYKKRIDVLHTRNKIDIEFKLNGIRFRWNESKAILNIKNHDVSFEQAAEVFFDPLVIGQDASRNDEKRDAALGCDFDYRLLFVVHLEIEDEFIRIISARKATTHERVKYEA